MMAYVTVFVEAFRFVKRYRARKAAEREAERIERMLERKHQVELLQQFMTKLLDFSKSQNESIIALAKAQSAQAEAFSQWLKGFQTPAGAPIPSSSSSEEAEWLAEQRKLGEAGFPSDLPVEFQLAAALEKMNQAALGDFDREGSDFK